MNDEGEFRRAASAAIEALKQYLIAREEEAAAGFEVEEQGGALNVLFAGAGGKFVIAPNPAVRQIWITGPAASFRLDWNAALQKFVLPRSEEPLIELTGRLIDEHREH